MPLLPTSFRSSFCALALGASFLVVGCAKEDKSSSTVKGDESGKDDSKGNDGDKGEAKAKRKSERPNMATFRPLLAESARAELDAGGLLVDFGTADQHKYTRGGWKTGWAASKNEKGVTYAPADSRKSDVNVVIPDDGEVKEIIIRGRTAVAGQVLTVYVDGERIGDGKFESSWSTIRIPAKGLEPGLHGIDYVF